jgi:hypothetical protein
MVRLSGKRGTFTGRHFAIAMTGRGPVAISRAMITKPEYNYHAYQPLTSLVEMGVSTPQHQRKIVIARS